MSKAKWRDACEGTDRGLARNDWHQRDREEHYSHEIRRSRILLTYESVVALGGPTLRTVIFDEAEAVLHELSAREASGSCPAAAAMSETIRAASISLLSMMISFLFDVQ